MSTNSISLLKKQAHSIIYLRDKLAHTVFTTYGVLMNYRRESNLELQKLLLNVIENRWENVGVGWAEDIEKNNTKNQMVLGEVDVLARIRAFLFGILKSADESGEETDDDVDIGVGVNDDDDRINLQENPGIMLRIKAQAVEIYNLKQKISKEVFYLHEIFKNYSTEHNPELQQRLLNETQYNKWYRSTSSHEKQIWYDKHEDDKSKWVPLKYVRSASTLYWLHEIEVFKKYNQNVKTSDISMIINARWKNLSDKEKQPWYGKHLQEKIKLLLNMSH